MFRHATVIGAMTLLLPLLWAGEFNKKLNLGDPIPSFGKLPGIDGKEYTLNTFKDKDVLVLVVMGNRCPVSQDYEDRIIAFTKKHGGANGKVAIVGVNVDREHGLPKMAERAKEKGFNFPYVLDDTQQLSRDLGATVTPEFYVFNKDRKLVYMGAMDDDEVEPKVNYLEAAVTATLKGEKVEKAETRPFGCSVEYLKIPAAAGVELKQVKYDALKAAVRAQRGKVVIVDIWSSTCIPCMKAFPHMLEMQRKYESKGLVCLSVSIDVPKGRDAAQKFLDKQNAKIANYWLDEKQDFIQQKFDMSGPPVVFVFDRQGRRAAKFDNNDTNKDAFTPGDVEKVVQKLLEAPDR